MGIGSLYRQVSRACIDRLGKTPFHLAPGYSSLHCHHSVPVLCLSRVIFKRLIWLILQFLHLTGKTEAIFGIVYDAHEKLVIQSPSWLLSYQKALYAAKNTQDVCQL